MAPQGFSVAAQRLQQRFSVAIQGNTLGGADALDELAALASNCVDELDNSRKIVAYVLRTFLRAATYSFSERPVSRQEAEDFEQSCRSLIGDAIEYLLYGDADTSMGMSLCTKLINAHLTHLPMP